MMTDTEAYTQLTLILLALATIPMWWKLGKKFGKEIANQIIKKLKEKYGKPKTTDSTQ